MILTKKHLLEAGMPSWDVAKFNIQWPEGVEITPENYAVAEKIGLSPSVLFAAVCPSQEALKRWSENADCFGGERQLKATYDESVRMLRAKCDRENIERKCRLLIAALEGKP